MGKTCQSCGMPLTKDPEGGGRNADGSKSDLYCSYCYQDGAFLQPDMDVKTFQAFCVQQMKTQGLPGPLAWLFTRGIPRLDRWKSA